MQGFRRQAGWKILLAGNSKLTQKHSCLIFYHRLWYHGKYDQWYAFFSWSQSECGSKTSGAGTESRVGGRECEIPKLGLGVWYTAWLWAYSYTLGMPDSQPAQWMGGLNPYCILVPKSRRKTLHTTAHFPTSLKPTVVVSTVRVFFSIEKWKFTFFSLRSFRVDSIWNKQILSKWGNILNILDKIKNRSKCPLFGSGFQHNYVVPNGQKKIP